MWHWDGPSPIDGNLDFHRKKRCTEQNLNKFKIHKNYYELKEEWDNCGKFFFAEWKSMGSWIEMEKNGTFQQV